MHRRLIKHARTLSLSFVSGTEKEFITQTPEVPSSCSPSVGPSPPILTLMTVAQSSFPLLGIL